LIRIEAKPDQSGHHHGVEQAKNSKRAYGNQKSGGMRPFLSDSPTSESRLMLAFEF
jgi:hypothetical protein